MLLYDADDGQFAFDLVSSIHDVHEGDKIVVNCNKHGLYAGTILQKNIGAARLLICPELGGDEEWYPIRQIVGVATK